MFLKINSKSTTNRDAWEGEDMDTEEVLEIGQPAQKQRKQTKVQLPPTTNRDQTAEPLGDRETAEHCKRNTFSFEHGSGPRKNDNNRKQRTEEELNQLRKFPLQLHCKKKRRTRKSVANCHEKAEVKIEQMMAVHAELNVYGIYSLFFLKYRHFAAKISIYYIKQRFWIKPGIILHFSKDWICLIVSENRRPNGINTHGRGIGANNDHKQGNASKTC